MNQMRTFLIFAWLIVATILWMNWNKEQNAPPTATQIALAAAPTEQPQGLPAPSVPGGVPAPTVPTAPASVAAPQATVAAQIGPLPPAAAAPLTMSNDVLRLRLDGGNVRRAELLDYRVKRTPEAPLVRLFDDSAENFYIAQSGWVSSQGAPTHQAGFVAEQSETELTLADGAKTVTASFVWSGPEGVSIRRTYTLTRGMYALTVRDEVVNRSTKPWTGFVYRQLSRVPHVVKRGMTNPESFSFNGAVWYTPTEKYEKRAYDDFIDDGPLNITTDGGWVALLQHYFFSAGFRSPTRKPISRWPTPATSSASAPPAPSSPLRPARRSAAKRSCGSGPSCRTSWSHRRPASA